MIPFQGLGIYFFGGRKVTQYTFLDVLFLEFCEGYGLRIEQCNK